MFVTVAFKLRNKNIKIKLTKLSVLDEIIL